MRVKKKWFFFWWKVEFTKDLGSLDRVCVTLCTMILHVVWWHCLPSRDVFSNYVGPRRCRIDGGPTLTHLVNFLSLPKHLFHRRDFYTDTHMYQASLMLFWLALWLCARRRSGVSDQPFSRLTFDILGLWHSVLSCEQFWHISDTGTPYGRGPWQATDSCNDRFRKHAVSLVFDWLNRTNVSRFLATNGYPQL